MVELNTIGRLAAENDNCAIASQPLDQGVHINHQGTSFRLSHSVLVGHRFAVRSIRKNEPLLSWGLPFGTAVKEIRPGDAVCNQAALNELHQRQLNIPLPTKPNFSDSIPSFRFNADAFISTPPAALKQSMPTFQGYKRASRGIGTRNMIILVATNATVAGFVRQLERRLKAAVQDWPQIDDIVAVVHTEGVDPNSNNRKLLLRTLAGFIVHPNVGAALIVDNQKEGLSNEAFKQYLLAEGYPLDKVIHNFMSIDTPFDSFLNQGVDLVTQWLDPVNQMRRSAVPVSTLKVALQCGGSDAFSGISGNPLVAWVARELILYGGSANLAETDELVGAESYMLQKVKDRNTAEQFLKVIERFKQWAARHGHSAEDNPSGGNIYRGLYNIYLKSLGAASKRHPETRLDYVIDYGEPMTSPGYYFMDSPGNDLESVAGQVASGCNLIFFVTGNGSITNFPFVPTIKVVTTSERYNLLAEDMDINAGAYLDGRSMPSLGRETFNFTLRIASGEKSAGEKAGHSQVQIWRNWQLGATQKRIGVIAKSNDGRLFDGHPLSLVQSASQIDSSPNPFLESMPQESKPIGLILPTSLCSGQIARLVVNRLNNDLSELDNEFSRFATLVHTEGCGVTTQAEFVNTMLGYMTHPTVGACLLLEHGCEKTHNAYWRQQLIQSNLDPQQFGWVSIQLDGGIEKSIAKCVAWFSQQKGQSRQHFPLKIGLVTDDQQAHALGPDLGQWVLRLLETGGSVILPEGDPIIQTPSFSDILWGDTAVSPTLQTAQKIGQPGLHIMDRASHNWTETLTGLGATGIHLILSFSNQPRNGHPLIPVLQIGYADQRTSTSDLDWILEENSSKWEGQLASLIKKTVSGQYIPEAQRQQNVDFQITRGLLGISV